MTRKRKITIGLVGLLIIGEGTLRLFFHERLKTMEFPRVYEPDEQIGYRYVPLVHGRICIPGLEKEFVINSAGFPGPEFAKEKKEGVFRIAIVDNSNGTGLFMPGERCYRDQLDELLQRDALQPVEVLNFSIDGRFRARSKIRLVQDEVLQYQPDLILLVLYFPFQQSDVARDVYRDYVMIYGTSDPELREKSKALIDDLQDHYGVRKAIYKASYLVRACVRVYLHRLSDPREDQRLLAFVSKKSEFMGGQLRMDENQSIQETMRLNKWVRDAGSQLVVFDYYGKQAASLDRIRGFEVAVIRAGVPDTKDVTNPEDPSHFNEQGHTHITDGLIQGIRRLRPNLFANSPVGSSGR